MKKAEEWIADLALEHHPEGGFYREVYRSMETIDGGCLPPGFSGPRNISTSIFYLLRSGEKSLLHRLKSDESWYFHAGDSITLVMLEDQGIRNITLGFDTANGHRLHFVVPANTWFGAFIPMADSYALCSCNVAPGFDFADFEIASRDVLTGLYPGLRAEIEMFTTV